MQTRTRCISEEASESGRVRACKLKKLQASENEGKKGDERRTHDFHFPLPLKTHDLSTWTHFFHPPLALFSSSFGVTQNACISVKSATRVAERRRVLPGAMPPGIRVSTVFAYSIRSATTLCLVDSVRCAHPVLIYISARTTPTLT